MSKDFCPVFALAGRRYALLSPIFPLFGREQLLDVVELRDDDYIVPHRLPACAEVSIGDEEPFVVVRSNNTAGHPYGRQTRTAQLAVTLAIGDTARAQLEQLDESEGQGLSAG